MNQPPEPSESETDTIKLTDPRVTIAGIRQFGLAPDGSDLRDLEAAFQRLASPPPTRPSPDAELIVEMASFLREVSSSARTLGEKIIADGLITKAAARLSSLSVKGEMGR